MKSVTFVMIISIIYPGVQNTYQTGFPLFYYVTPPKAHVFEVPTTHYSTFNQPYLTYPDPSNLEYTEPTQQDYDMIPRTVQEQEIETPKFRGYAYQTRTESGATSRVLFVTGAQSQNIGSSFYALINEQVQQPTQQNLAKNVASDILDPFKKSSNIDGVHLQNDYSKSAQNIYISPENSFSNNTNDVISNLFQSPLSGTVNFYSSNSNIIPQFLSHFSTLTQFPSSLFPSTKTQSSTTESDNNTSTESSDIVVDSIINAKNNKIENEAQESVITNTRFSLNDINDTIRKDTEVTNSSLFLSQINITTESTENLILENATKVINIGEVTSTSEELSIFATEATSLPITSMKTTPDQILTTFSPVIPLSLDSSLVNSTETTQIETSPETIVKSLSTLTTEENFKQQESVINVTQIALNQDSAKTVTTKDILTTASLTADTTEISTDGNSALNTSTTSSNIQPPEIISETTANIISIKTSSSSPMSVATTAETTTKTEIMLNSQVNDDITKTESNAETSTKLLEATTKTSSE